MNRLLTTFIYSLLLSAAGQTHVYATTGSASYSGTQGVTVLVLGDSISAGYGIQTEAGWVSLLAERLMHLAPANEVINASVSGETTGGGLARLPAALRTHRPDFVIIELGGNDGLRGYPIDRIKANLTEMVQMAQNAGAQVLLVAMAIPPNYGPRYTSAFQQAYEGVAAATGARLAPFLMNDVALDRELMQDDGIHPTAAAQPLLLNAVWPYLEPLVSAAGVAEPR
jgi:acyl-CoA thioesterase-1